jgi:hypothetical protein
MDVCSEVTSSSPATCSPGSTEWAAPPRRPASWSAHGATSIGVARHGAHGAAVFFVAHRVIVVVARQRAGGPQLARARRRRGKS